MTTEFVMTDWWNLCAGDVLGEGASRKVMVYAINPDYVLKIEEARYSFKNVSEWNFWNDNKKTDLKKWLAPIKHISPCGSILIQKRVSPCREKDLPKKIPACFTDLKTENWGWLGGSVVCCDYANHIAKYSQKMKKANWN